MAKKVLQTRKPTQADVAKLAGVSRAAVSYVLNNKYPVSIPEATRQRILDAIEELGYVPDRNAQSLRTGRTYTIASVIPDITNPYYPLLERKIQDVAKKYGYVHITYNTDGIAEEEYRCLQAVQQGRVDGVFGSFFHVGPEDLRPLVEQNMAVVCLVAARQEAPDFPLDMLYVDNVAAAYLAVTYLIERGHTCISMIGGLDVAVGQKRMEGYVKALTEHRLPIAQEMIRHGDFTEESGYREMCALLQISPRPTAVFTANDLMALGALFAIKESGLRVPDDVAIVGFDDIPTSRLVSPPLTTIRKPQDLIGQRAVEMMLERINRTVAPTGRCEEIPFELIIRQSA
ncbi:MAG: LacI family DNA-binding transcriptional regulator [Aggregatilineaceae bacterium]